MDDLEEETNEFWVSVNYAFKFFTKPEVDQFLSSFLKNGMPPKGTNIMFRHVKIKNPISKAQLLDMSNEDMKLFLEMINDDNRD